MIPIIIPTMPQRGRDLATLEAALQRLPWTDVRPSYHVDSRQDVARAAALGTLAAERHRAAWWVYMEDDVALAPDFGALPDLLDRTDEAVGAVTCFWSVDLDDGRKRIPARRLSMSQCIAFRTSLPWDTFTEFSRQWYLDNPRHHHASDLLLGAFVAAQKLAVEIITPSLVQHRPLKSTLGPRSKHRQSPSYTRTWGEVT